MNRHLSQDELIARLYGLDENKEHLELCSECATRYREFEAKLHTSASHQIDVPVELLAAQRRSILARLDQASVARTWIPAAAVAALVMALLLSGPRESTAPVVSKQMVAKQSSASTETDLQLFTDIYAMEQSVEPRAAAPIRALFEEEAQ